MLLETKRVPGGENEYRSYTLDKLSVKPNAATETPGFVQTARDTINGILLPRSYPFGVAPEYMEFQLWDTLQELSGYLLGIVTGSVNLIGMGVGEDAAMVSSVLIRNVIKDLSNVGVGIYVSQRYAKDFGSDMKTYWLLGETICALTSFFFMLAMLDWNIGMSRQQIWFWATLIQSLVNCGASICQGVAKAGLAHHLARAHNFSDVAAKEGNQNRFGKLFVIFIAYKMIYGILETSPFWTLVSYVFLNAFKYVCVYKSIKTLALRTLNIQRANIVMSLLDGASEDKKAEKPTVDVFSVATRENILPPTFRPAFGISLTVGNSLQSLPKTRLPFEDLNTSVFSEEQFVLCSTSDESFYLFLREGVSTEDQILGFLTAWTWSSDATGTAPTLELAKKCLAAAKARLPSLLKALRSEKWDLEVVHFCDDGWRLTKDKTA